MRSVNKDRLWVLIGMRSLLNAVAPTRLPLRGHPQLLTAIAILAGCSLHVAREEPIKDPANVLARQLTRVMDAPGRVRQTTGRQ